MWKKLQTDKFIYTRHLPCDEGLYYTHVHFITQRDLIITLCSVVKDCKNFKVRINAALALGSPTLRSHYGDGKLYRHVWESLVTGLQTAEDITDFGEFRYRDQLNNQVTMATVNCATMCSFSLRVYRRPRTSQTLGSSDAGTTSIIRSKQSCFYFK